MMPRDIRTSIVVWVPHAFKIAEDVPGALLPLLFEVRKREFISYHSFADSEVSELFAAVLHQANLGEREAIRALDESVPWKAPKSS